MGFGDQSGAKQSTLRTYLQDAADHGAELLTGCEVQRVIVEDGRAAGVSAVWSDGTSSAAVTVRAPQVVLAAGSLETPGVLLRTGIGGPAAGRYLRLHPCSATVGDYGEDMQAWWGAPHSGLGYGVRQPQGWLWLPARGRSVHDRSGCLGDPIHLGRRAQAADARLPRVRHDDGLVRDRGSGQVTIDESGASVPWYEVTDPVDLHHTREALERQIRAHVAAGARRVFVLAQGLPAWRVGDDLDLFIARARRIPARAGGLMMFSAHQMGSARMGSDPERSVANPWGELPRRSRRVDRRCLGVPDPVGHQPDDHDHGARVAHGRAHHRSDPFTTLSAGPGGLSMSTTPTLITHEHLYIGGQWIGAGAGTIDVINPASEDVLGRVPEGTPADVEREP